MNDRRMVGMWVGVALLVVALAWCVPVLAGGVDGSQLFEIHCAGCHPNGGNVIRRGKNLRSRALKRDGYDTVEAIAEIVAKGKNNMSAYRDRLSEEEIAAVSAYVLDRSRANWWN